MKIAVQIFLTLYTVAEFGIIGYVVSKFDLHTGAIGCLIWLAYQLNYFKQSALENQIFELKELLEKKL